MKRTKYMIIILVILIAAGFLTTIIKTNHSSQALTAFLLPIRFVGEYSLGDEPWRELTPVSKLPADDRELRLRGHFDIDFTLDEVMFLYLDHTDVIIKVNGQEMVNTFMPTERMAEDFCGVYWYECLMQGVTKDDYIEIMLHCAHDFGHNNAYHDFVDRFYTAPAYFLRGVILQMGTMSRMMALMGVVLSLLILGFSLAFSRMGFSSGGKLTILGLSSLLMSGYIALDTPDVALWSEVILTNTSGLHLCMMLAALGFGFFIMDVFEHEKKRVCYDCSICHGDIRWCCYSAQRRTCDQNLLHAAAVGDYAEHCQHCIACLYAEGTFVGINGEGQSSAGGLRSDAGADPA